MYDLAELLKNPDKPLTPEQLDHWDEYTRPRNEPKPDCGISIEQAIEELLSE